MDTSTFVRLTNRLLTSAQSRIDAFQLKALSVIKDELPITGLEESGLPRKYIFYRKNETEHPTVKAYLEGKPLLVLPERNQNPKYKEKVRSNFSSALMQPFFPPRGFAKASEGVSLGVIRLINRQICHDNRIENATFTWEDLEIAQFLGDILGVVTHMYQREARRADDFERITHGLEASLLTVLAALNNIHEVIDYEKLVPERLRYQRRI